MYSAASIRRARKVAKKKAQEKEPLLKFTNAQLKAQLAKLGVDHTPSQMKKNDLIALLNEKTYQKVQNGSGGGSDGGSGAGEEKEGGSAKRGGAGAGGGGAGGGAAGAGAGAATAAAAAAVATVATVADIGISPRLWP